jgi:hypothetical protein
MCDLGMSFGDALNLLKNGYFVTREAWNGEGMYLRPYAHSKMTLPHIYLMHQRGKTPWLASQTDILTDDWRLA